jgi:hypothetical protein
MTSFLLVPKSNISRVLVVLILGSSVMGCASNSDFDLGMYGTPTPALAMYASQVKHASDVCSQSVDKEENERFLKFGVTRGLALAYYREKFPSFSSQEGEFLSKYLMAWGEMNAQQKLDFCSTYRGDLNWSKEKWLKPIVVLAMNFRRYFSPVSEERLELAQKARIVAGGLSLGLTTAGVAKTNQQDFSTARQFNNQGGMFASVVMQGGALTGLPCEQYAPFVQAVINPNDVKFSMYYSIVKCSNS